jgi:hypothetical protein
MQIFKHQHEIGAVARPFAGCAAAYVPSTVDTAWMTDNTSLSTPGSEEMTP